MNAGNETVMEQVGPEKLLEIAHQLASNGERFHNHVLSADCELNDRGQCALILEASDRNQVFVTYSDEPMMDVGRSLASLVHGADALEGSINENQEGDLASRFFDSGRNDAPSQGPDEAWSALAPSHSVSRVCFQSASRQLDNRL